MFGASSAIGSVSNPPAQSGQSSAVGSSSQSIDGLTISPSDFLQMMVTEMQNQDPTQPTDPLEYMSELGSLGQLSQLSTIVQELSGGSGGLMQSASAYLGRSVSAPGSNIGVAAGTASSISFVPSSPGSYRVLISDSNGNQVQQVSLGNLPAGAPQTFTWQPPSGTPDGTYAATVINNAGGSPPALNEQGVVQTVTMVNGSAMLDLTGGLSIPASSVTSVAAAS